MMTFLSSNHRPSNRLHRGDRILANAAQLDTGRVQPRLDAFFELHRRYIEAQADVNEAEALAARERRLVDRLDSAVSNALVMLSAALQLNGESQRNSFGRFAPLGPGKMKLLSSRRKIIAVRELAATLRGSLGVRPAVLDAAAAAEQAAAQVETALAGWTLRCTYLGMTRQFRDALGLQWDDAYRALNLLSRSVVEEPGLHAVLFNGARPTRRAKKAGAAALPPQVVETQEEESPTTAPAKTAIEPQEDATDDPLQAVRRLLEPFAAATPSATADRSSGHQKASDASRRAGGEVLRSGLSALDLTVPRPSSDLGGESAADRVSSAGLQEGRFNQREHEAHEERICWDSGEPAQGGSAGASSSSGSRERASPRGGDRAGRTGSSVVLARIIENPQVPALFGGGIRQHRIDLPPL